MPTVPPDAWGVELTGASHRRQAPWRLIVVVLVVTAALAVILTRVIEPEQDDPSEAKRTTIVEVVKGEVASQASYDGTLGFGEASTVGATSSGVVTRIAEEGEVVRRGEALWRINQRPVVLFVGQLPFYRPLADGAEGLDVLVLERNLKRLGFARGLTPNRTFGSATTDALESFQEAKNLPETGTLNPADVVVRREPARIVERRVEQGSPVRTGQPMLALTGNSREVRFAIDATEREIFEGSRRPNAVITLPDGEEVKARRVSVGTVTSNAEGRTTSTLQARLRVPGKKVSQWGEVQVEATVVSQRKTDVLYVPVTALLALAEGGYGLEVVQGGGTRLVGVTVGLIADGRAEVSGSIAEGQKVVAAA